MFRIDDPTAVGSLPAPGTAGTEGYFTEGNPGVTPATLVTAAFLNMVQEELRNVVTGAGLTPSKSTYDQVASAIKVMMQRAAPSSASAVGTADAITASFTPAIATLTNGMVLYIRAAAANTTTTPTFTPNSGTIAAKTIVKGAGAALLVADIAGAGHWVELQYDQTSDVWVLRNPAYGLNSTDPVGKVDLFFDDTAPAGWLEMNGNTIGSAASGATARANADTLALYTKIWNKSNNTDFPVQTSAGAPTTRGASAAADFAANKRLPLPDGRGYGLRGWDHGRGVDSGRTLGSAQADMVKGYQVDTVSVRAWAYATGSTETAYSPTVVVGPGAETRMKNLAFLVCIKY